MKNYDLIVVGAGPAGLLAAGRAAEMGASVLVLEKMRQEGRKLLITGKGRCNITNDASISDFISHVHPSGRFLKNALSQYYSEDIIALLSKYGLDVVLERGGRYFPSTEKASDVLKVLLKWTNDLHVDIKCGERVKNLKIENSNISGLISDSGEYKTKAVILATGGKSYPATGSTGDGYEMAIQAGHSLQKPLPALVPLETDGNLAQSLQGLNLKNVNAVLWVDGKKIGEEFGELIFTHFGLSGPIILTLSRMAVDALQKNKKVDLSIDLKPALDEQKLDRRLLRDLDEHGKKKIENIFHEWLPSSMISVFLKLTEIDPAKEGHQLSSKERKQIRHLLKNLTFNIKAHRSFKEAIITSGGVPTSEISSKTMESKIIKGLFFAGEIIDFDADTGGYNLQIAYSTGWLAGQSAAYSKLKT